MPQDNRNILFCYVFNEQQAIVDELYRQFEYRSPKNFGFRISSLNDSNARAESPIEASVKAVKASSYCVVLLGNSLGGKPSNSNRSYLQHEVEAARKSEGTKLFIWAIGEHFWHGYNSELVNPEVRGFLNSLSSEMTIGELKTENADFVASKILNALEEDIAKSNMDEDVQPPQGGLLEVSGFNPSSVKISKNRIGQQLKVIYGGDQLHYSTQTLDDYQKLAFEEMRLRNVDGGIRSMERVIDYFDSDLIGNFWFARLVLFHKLKPDEDRLNRAKSSCIKTLGALEATRSDTRLIASMCYAFLAKYYQIKEQFDDSEEYLRQSLSESYLYDAIQIQAENLLILNNAADQLPASGLSKAAKSLYSIYQHNVFYYFYLESHFNSTFGKPAKVLADSVGDQVFSVVMTLFSYEKELDSSFQFPLRAHFPSVWAIKEAASASAQRSLKLLVTLLEQKVEDIHQFNLHVSEWNESSARLVELRQNLLKANQDERSVRLSLGLNEQRREKESAKTKGQVLMGLSIVLAVLFVFVAHELTNTVQLVAAIAALASGISFFTLLGSTNDLTEEVEQLSKKANEAMAEVTNPELLSSASPLSEAEQLIQRLNEAVKEAETAQNHDKTNLQERAANLVTQVHEVSARIPEYEFLVLNQHAGQYKRAAMTESQLSTRSGRLAPASYLPNHAEYLNITDNWLPEEFETPEVIARQLSRRVIDTDCFTCTHNSVWNTLLAIE